MNKSTTKLLGFLFLGLILSPLNTFAQTPTKRTSPLLGWNSYNCYGTHINEKLTWEN